MRVRWLDPLAMAYGALLAAAGLYGFYKAHSIISLVAGLVSGALVIGLTVYSRTNPRVGRIGVAVISLLMLGQFVPGYMKKHLTSQLILIVASVVVFACLLGSHFYAMSRRNVSPV